MSAKMVVYPWTFDPVTNGHMDVIELVLLPATNPLSSSMVRTVHENGGDITPFVPASVLDYFK